MFSLIFRKGEKSAKNISSEVSEEKTPVLARIFYIDEYGIGHYCFAEKTWEKGWICYDASKRPFERITEDIQGFKIIRIYSEEDRINFLVFKSFISG